MKPILVPTDFSDCADSAAACALDLAKQAGCEVHFLHLINIPDKWAKLPIGTMDGYPDEIRERLGKAQNSLNQWVDKARQAGIQAHGYLAFNESVDEIYAHAEKHDCGLLVVGSHGSKGLREVFIGSNAQRMIRYAPAPVLVIKGQKSPLSVRNIVFAASFREDVHASFGEVLRIADMLKAGVHLLYVNMPYMFEETKTTVARLREFAKQYPERSLGIHIYNAFDEESGILQFAAEHRIEMVALTTHGKSGWVQILSPSIAESLVNHSDIPVMTINAKSKK